LTQMNTSRANDYCKIFTFTLYAESAIFYFFTTHQNSVICGLQNVEATIFWLKDDKTGHLFNTRKKIGEKKKHE